jgi:outer membrane protein OmpA-like peptidoglycan-associated protein
MFVPIPIVEVLQITMIEKGIAPERLTANGYGESKLINQCADGVKCTTEQHQANRRSEFIIIE